MSILDMSEYDAFHGMAAVHLESAERQISAGAVSSEGVAIGPARVSAHLAHVWAGRATRASNSMAQRIAAAQISTAAVALVTPEWMR